MKTFILIPVVLAMSVTAAFSQSTADTIAFYNSKYNSTALVPVKEYISGLKEIFKKDTAVANTYVAYIHAQANDTNRRENYAYLAPNYFVNVKGYSPREHLVKMNNVMYSIFTSGKFLLLRNGKVYTTASLEMDTGTLYCVNERCGKKWILRIKNDGTIVYEGIKKIKRSALPAEEPPTKM